MRIAATATLCYKIHIQLITCSSSPMVGCHANCCYCEGLARQSYFWAFMGISMSTVGC